MGGVKAVDDVVGWADWRDDGAVRVAGSRLALSLMQPATARNVGSVAVKSRWFRCQAAG